MEIAFWNWIAMHARFVVATDAQSCDFSSRLYLTLFLVAYLCFFFSQNATN